MSLWHAAIYGFIQGLSEFLPISSSAHLTLLPYFTGWEDPGLAFDVALHWGTLFAVVIYFWKDVQRIAAGFLGSLQGKRDVINQLPWKIIAATIPGALMGLLFEKQAETIFRAPWITAITLSVMGLLLLIADKIGSKKMALNSLSFTQACVIGILQGFAIIPGVSRSGVTIMMGLLFGLEREAAVRFSFYLSMPIIFGAGLLKAKYLFHNMGDPVIMVAIGSSGFFGMAAIHILLTYIRTKTFTPFVIYRFALAAFVVAWMLTH